MAVVLANSVNGNVNLAIDDTLYLLNDSGFILDNNDDGIDVVASGTELVVRGTVGSDILSGIHIDNFLGPQTDNTIIVASTGIVVGNEDGIRSSDGSGTDVIINYGGLVTGGNDGIALDGDSNVVTNNGKIVGESGEGVDLDGNNNRVVNTGEIVSHSAAAVIFSSVAGEANSLFSSGTISGQDADGNAVITGDGDEHVTNSGTINGNVSLGGGNDQFDGTGGTVNGTVSGGAGDDVYIVDDPTLSLVEGPDEGIDTVLADTGWTLGDNFENLNLLGDGDHTGVGNNLANIINGNIGDNTIDGGGGDDVIRGGDGDDTLLGGGGNDRVIGNSGNDVAHGGAGNDDVLGGGGDDVLRGGAGDDGLGGGSGNDRLFGGSGDDRLYGGPGEDALTGGTGRDVLFGGPDADRFVYDSVLDSPVGTGNRDRIQHFSSAHGDQIDLSGIDANVNTAGDDGFTFIGTSAFSGSAGELRVVDAGTNLLVRGDVDGNGSADFEIFVFNTAGLSAGDFVL